MYSLKYPTNNKLNELLYFTKKNVVSKMRSNNYFLNEILFVIHIQNLCINT